MIILALVDEHEEIFVTFHQERKERRRKTKKREREREGERV